VTGQDSLPADGFRYTRRVQFAETDLAGIVHFSMMFRYMEEAEHALWRAAGMSIARAGEETGWPRVSASFDFRSPLRFEDEFEVILKMAAVNKRTLQYACTIRRGDTTIGTGTMTTACVTKSSGGAMRAVELPLDVVARLQSALGQPT
jgi:acyl-CoA thioester hydrolase